MARNNRDGLIRSQAAALVTSARITAPPVPIEHLVAEQGLVITQGPIPVGWGYFDPAAWAITLSSELFAASPEHNRRRFTLAHELGHCVLEHGDLSCWAAGRVAEPAQLDDLDDFPDFEREAHQFARELLLPRAWFTRDWTSDPSPEDWASIYAVSRETLFIVLTERKLLMTRRTRR